jgi:hypothetical protein
MQKSFNELRERLLRAGVAPRHVRRYLAELADHLADLRAEEERTGLSRSDAEAAALVRLGGIDELSKAMTEQRQFQSLCVRAPWAVFGLAPLFLLAGAYFTACMILWSGWKIFLPGTDMPFVRVHGFAILYFGVGKWLYFSAPILVGWVIGVVAYRQKFRAAWPTVGMAMTALIGSVARVHASGPAGSGGAGHVSMNLAFGPSVQDVSSVLFHTLAILSFSLLPSLVLRFKKSYLLPS